MADNLTADGPDSLGLSAHMNGNPFASQTGTAQPSAGCSWATIVGAIGILAVLWFLFKTVRV